MRYLDSSQLEGITKKEFLNPSTEEMKEKVEFAKQCCEYVISLPQNAKFSELISHDADLVNISDRYIFVAMKLKRWSNMSEDFINNLDSSFPKNAEDYIVTYDTTKMDHKWKNYKEEKAILEAYTSQQKHADEIRDLGARAAGFGMAKILNTLNELNSDTDKKTTGYNLSTQSITPNYGISNVNSSNERKDNVTPTVKPRESVPKTISSSKPILTSAPNNSRISSSKNVVTRSPSVVKSIEPVFDDSLYVDPMRERTIDILAKTEFGNKPDSEKKSVPPKYSFNPNESKGYSNSGLPGLDMSEFLNYDDSEQLTSGRRSR